MSKTLNDYLWGLKPEESPGLHPLWYEKQLEIMNPVPVFLPICSPWMLSIMHWVGVGEGREGRAGSGSYIAKQRSETLKEMISWDHSW